MVENPYVSPESAPELVEPYPGGPKEYGGTGRLAYVASMAGLMILRMVMIYAAAEQTVGHVIVLMLSFLFLFLYLIPTYFRLQNIGSNPWWCLGLIVPLLNLLIIVRCVIVPEGYTDTKELDLAGKIMAAIVLALFLLLCLLLAVIPYWN